MNRKESLKDKVQNAPGNGQWYRTAEPAYMELWWVAKSLPTNVAATMLKPSQRWWIQEQRWIGVQNRQERSCNEIGQRRLILLNLLPSPIKYLHSILRTNRNLACISTHTDGIKSSMTVSLINRWFEEGSDLVWELKRFEAHERTHACWAWWRCRWDCSTGWNHLNHGIQHQ